MSTMEREQTRDAWDGIAGGYDEFVTPTHIRLANEALELAAVGPGQRFLDVAAGSGALSIPAARRGARVTATDISPTMVDRLAERVRAEGLAGVEALVMDGHALDLEDDCFDASGSQFGVMLFPDLPRALGEMARVTRPGGRVLMVVFGPPDEIDFLRLFVRAVKAVEPGFTGLPSDPPPLPFQVADPRKLRRELTDAGLTDVRVERSAETLEVRSGEELWDWIVNSNPIPLMLISDLTEAQRAEVRLVLDGLVRERSGGNGPAVLTSPINIGIGTVPQA